MVSEFAVTFLDLFFFYVMVYELQPNLECAILLLMPSISKDITPMSNPFNLFTTMWFHNNEI